jgi:uncharacterized protein YkwD
MKWKQLSACLGLALSVLWTAHAADQVISRPRPAAQPQIAGFTNYNSDSFRKLPIAQKPINSSNPNLDLLDAAVFHESNRRRKQHGLKPLLYHSQTREAARMHSRDMAKGEFIEHINPNPGRRKPEDRAKLAGLKPRMLAENVANAFGRRYKSGQSFYTREENGRKIYSYEPDGPPIPLHTYISFAEALVESWMQSPGHRENLLHTVPEYLGCACEPSSNRKTMETFYCTQVFYLPMDP